MFPGRCWDPDRRKAAGRKQDLGTFLPRLRGYGLHLVGLINLEREKSLVGWVALWSVLTGGWLGLTVGTGGERALKKGDPPRTGRRRSKTGETGGSRKLELENARGDRQTPAQRERKANATSRQFQAFLETLQENLTESFCGHLTRIGFAGL